MFNLIDLSVADRIATITLNRPDAMNAYTVPMRDEIIAALDIVDADNEISAVIFTGAGRAYCAGMDLSVGAEAFERGDVSLDEQKIDSGGRLSLRIYNCTKPVIAAINGAAVGIGATMTLPMDIRLASDKAKFGFVFTRRGIVLESCSSWFLPRLVGVQQAAEWTFTGRVFDAQEALAGGLVRSVHAPEDLLAAARALATEIVANTAPVSVAMSRQLMYRMLGAAHPMEAHIIESNAMYLRGKSADMVEGVTSFLEKRPAAYPDRAPRDLPDIYPDWVEPPFRTFD